MFIIRIFIVTFRCDTLFKFILTKTDFFYHALISNFNYNPAHLIIHYYPQHGEWRLEMLY